MGAPFSTAAAWGRSPGRGYQVPAKKAYLIGERAALHVIAVR